MTVVLVGPTASGKSALAVALARAYEARGQAAEVVNADSMLLYRGMDVGTAKPDEAQRAGIAHHLLDVLDVTQTATVAAFQRAARECIAQIRARGAVSILVGGSALYVRAVVDAFEFPGTDAELRVRLEGELAAHGPAKMYERLAAADPEAARHILPGNQRRVVRALEVIELTGAPFRAELPERRYALADVVQIGLDVPRPVLDERIRRRVEAMWAAGLVAETESLVTSGLREGVTASRALGYRQVLSFLAGELTQDQAREETVVATRKFARRQDAWFRKDPRITWLAFDRPDLVTAVLAAAGPTGSG